MYLSVEPDKFLFDYKILLFSFILIIILLIIIFKNKKYRKLALEILTTDILFTAIYMSKRIEETNRFGYRYKLETNTDFTELLYFIIGIVIVFLIFFIGEKLISRIRGGK